MKKLLIISILLSPFCILNYSQPYQNGRQESGWQVISSGTVNDFKLSQNYPNPFNPTTIIKFTLLQDERREIQDVRLLVYDVLGNEVATLINKEKPAGEYEVEFNGNGLTSGIYFYQLKVGSFIETKKMVLLK